MYWYMGGPGVDPHYNGTTSEASAWGAQQAAWTLAAAKADDVDYKVMRADIELPGIAAADQVQPVGADVAVVRRRRGAQRLRRL